MTPEPRALRYPYSVLSFDRIGRWWRECKMLGLGQDVKVRVSDPAMRIAMPRSPGVGQQGPMMGTDHSVALRHDDVQQGPMIGTGPRGHEDVKQGPMMGTDLGSVTLRHDDVQQGPMMGTEVSVTLRYRDLGHEVMGIVRNPGGPVGSLKSCGPRGPLECSCDPKLVPTPAQGAGDDHGCWMCANDPVPSMSMGVVRGPGGPEGPSEGSWGPKGPLECRCNAAVPARPRPLSGHCDFPARGRALPVIKRRTVAHPTVEGGGEHPRPSRLERRRL